MPRTCLKDQESVLAIRRDGARGSLMLLMKRCTYNTKNACDCFVANEFSCYIIFPYVLLSVA